MAPALVPRHDNFSKQSATWEVIFPIISTLSVLARVSLRRKYKIKLGWDDGLIICSLPLCWALWALWYCSWHYLSPPYFSPENLPTILKISLCSVFLGVTGVTFIKASVLVFYLRAFGTISQCRIWVYILLAVNIAYGFVRFFYFLFACTPPSRFWNDLQSCHGNFYAFAMAITAIGLATELAILIFPLPIIWSLKMQWQRRLAIGFAFGLALIVLLACALRIYLFTLAQDERDIIFGSSLSAAQYLLQMIENNIGILAANVPATWSPLKQFISSCTTRFRGHRALSETVENPSESDSHQIEYKVALNRVISV